MAFKTIFWCILAPLLAFGFQVIPGGNTWNINSTSATNSKLFVVYPSAALAVINDLPTGDVLAGSATVTVQQVMNSVFDDYNNIAGAFFTLVDSNDADYAQNSANRTITIEVGSVSGATSGGQASYTSSGGRRVGCKITIIPRALESAKFLTMIITHELGHCMGLEHPMDTVNSIMSYYASSEFVRLQTDDKMGLVYLYPTDPAKAKEDPTLGFACARK
jgi:hypothetical protein